jgi:membrane fusion protein (multidrug efflux system)
MYHLTDIVHSEDIAAVGVRFSRLQPRSPFMSDASIAARSPRRGALQNPLVRGLLIVAGVGVLALIVVFGFGWWTHGRFVQSTDDAYLRADEVTISPKVLGYVDQVFVKDNQDVTAGQPLVRIDARSYDAAVAQQAAAIDARIADIQTAQRQVDQQEAAIAEARVRLATARINAAYAAGEADRYRTLSRQGVETLERYGQAANQKDQADQAVKADEAAVAVAEQQAKALRAQIVQAKAQLEAAKASDQSARLNLSDTLLTSSIAGRVGDKTVRVGQFVQPGTRLMSIVPIARVYLVANFKETQIGRMRVGQHASVKIDALGGRSIDAVVESFSPGTGAQFALLPPENATGNFIKIVQRVPVRLRLLAPEDLRDRLIPGLSATVAIDTLQAPERRA